MVLHEINGKKYVEFEVTLSKSSSELEGTLLKVKNWSGIVRKFNLVDGGFWGSTMVNASFLIPEEHAKDF